MSNAKRRHRRRVRARAGDWRIGLAPKGRFFEQMGGPWRAERFKLRKNSILWLYQGQDYHAVCVSRYPDVRVVLGRQS